MRARISLRIRPEGADTRDGLGALLMSDVTQYLVRWLCHDLATPIASVMTASELLDDTPDTEINELIRFGAKRLTSRLRLVRLALGAAESDMAGGQLEKMVKEGLDSTSVDWSWEGDATGGMATLIAGCIMLVADLNRTRPLAVDQKGVTVAPACTWPEPVAAVFKGAAPTCNRGSVAAMLMQAAERAGKRLAPTPTGLTWDA